MERENFQFTRTYQAKIQRAGKEVKVGENQKMLLAQQSAQRGILLIRKVERMPNSLMKDLSTETNQIKKLKKV